MTGEAEAAAVVTWLEGSGATYQVNGGWAVDALVGRQTRPHGDLDVFLDARQIEAFLDWLAHRTYVVIDDWRPVRVELASTAGRVDVHPMVVDQAGDGVQQGLGDEVFRHAAADRTRGEIAGTPVTVACAARLRELRRGYPLREVDRHDLGILRGL